MKPYEWMVRFTPQTEWIQRRGILLWLAFFFIELGAGLFFVASIFNTLWGMFIGWLICGLLGGGLHLLYLGRPLRFFRMLLRPQTSWLSRGLIFVVVFLVLGATHTGLALREAPVASLLIATDIVAFLVVIYGGFAMNYVNGIPLWNTALLPILYLISGFWGGAELTLGIALATGGAAVGIAVEEWIRMLLVGYILVLAVYLISIRYGPLGGGVSVREMLIGNWWPLMWMGVGAIGLALPLTVVITSSVIGLEATPHSFLYIGLLAGLIGDVSMRYLILRCGLYSPLIPSSIYRH